MSTDQTSICANDLKTCMKVLSKFSKNDGYPSLESAEYLLIQPLISNLFHIGQRLKRKRLQTTHREVIHKDRETRKQTCLLRSGRAKQLEKLQLENIIVPDGVVETDSVEDKNESSSAQRLIQHYTCYICKLKYRTLHFFYDQLCPGCAKLNYEKRIQTTDLSNFVALVTGGRVKIGYRIVLKLLRANCFVIATTRFPMDLLNRLNKEADFDQWKDRVHIYAVDFRYSQLIEIFAQMLIDKYAKLDFLINNACQTIQRPNEYYQYLKSHEQLSNYSLLPDDQQKILDGNLQFYQRFAPITNRLKTDLLSLPSAESTSNSLVNQMKFDVNQQPLDFRTTNSWVLRLNEISTNEINEVLTINTLAPFILNSKLKILMTDKHPNRESIKFIINVSAMEGSFSRPGKTDRHPHINAAKAALNMMTRTSASDYKQSNIYMVSVDAGRINDPNPIDKAMKAFQKHDFQAPLDEEDAAARILDPIIHTYQQIAQGKTDFNIPYGCFLKDYQICDW